MPPERFVNVTFQVKKDGQSYSSFCPELKIPSYGDTASEATENLVTASLITFHILHENGTEQEFLKEKGINIGEVEEEPYVRIVDNSQQEGHYRLFIDAFRGSGRQQPTTHEIKEAVKNLA